MSPAAALQDMMWPLLQQLQVNVHGAMHSEDEEYLHQVRVTLRRLRVVLGVVKPLLGEDAQLANLRAELRALFRVLGQAREWDVFVTQTLAALRERFPEHAGLARLARRSEALRQGHHEAARAALQSTAFHGLLLRIALWLHDERWQQPGNRETASLMRFSARILRRCQQRVMRCGKRLSHTWASNDADSAQALHALRLASKKMRYSAELFSSLRTQEKLKRNTAALIRLQDILGSLNDIAVARRLLQELADEGHGNDAEDLVSGWLERDYAMQITRLRQAWDEFAKLRNL
jgi:CHAD domain-containing protein